MNEQSLFSSFAASSLIHLLLIPVAALTTYAKPVKPVMVPIELMDVPRVERPQKVGITQPPVSAPKAKPQNITPPKLLSKPEIIETKSLSPAGNPREEMKEPEKLLDAPPRLASLPDNPGSIKGGWNMGNHSGEAEGSAAGAGNLFGRGDVGVVGGSGVRAGGGGQGASGLGSGTQGDGAGGGGMGLGDALAGLARPLGGYQVKPRYPESARRAGVEGVTILRVKVLESGRVGEILVEKSAGHRDLDFSAVEAVKKWLFEPARSGKEPVAVWVILPVRFQLQ